VKRDSRAADHLHAGQARERMVPTSTPAGSVPKV
jgi:hypothetical protein